MRHMHAPVSLYGLASSPLYLSVALRSPHAHPTRPPLQYAYGIALPRARRVAWGRGRGPVGSVCPAEGTIADERNAIPSLQDTHSRTQSAINSQGAACHHGALGAEEERAG